MSAVLDSSIPQLDVKPLTPALGAELHGVDLAQCEIPGVYEAIRRALDEHGVIFFREQDLSDARFVEFVKRFGPLQGTDVLPEVGGENYGGLHVVAKKEPGQTWAVGENWHSDTAFCRAPAMGTALICREMPDVGGDTVWVSMAKVYESLSDGLKRTLLTLRAVNQMSENRLRQPVSNQNTRAKMGVVQETSAVHPVVTRHPNGRNVLFINPHNTFRFEGWTEEESAPLLEYLFRHAQRPDFQCRFRWRRGSIAVWDNRQTWHKAINDYGDTPRRMHRLLIAGDPPRAAAS